VRKDGRVPTSPNINVFKRKEERLMVEKSLPKKKGGKNGASFGKGREKKKREERDYTFPFLPCDFKGGGGERNL